MLSRRPILVAFRYVEVCDRFACPPAFRRITLTLALIVAVATLAEASPITIDMDFVASPWVDGAFLVNSPRHLTFSYNSEQFNRCPDPDHSGLFSLTSASITFLGQTSISSTRFGLEANMQLDCTTGPPMDTAVYVARFAAQISTDHPVFLIGNVGGHVLWSLRRRAAGQYYRWVTSHLNHPGSLSALGSGPVTAWQLIVPEPTPLALASIVGLAIARCLTRKAKR